MTPKPEPKEGATLRPCPFCGAEELQVHLPHMDESSIICANRNRCVCLSALGRETLIEMWNTRPIEDRLTQRCQELEKALELTLAALVSYKRYIPEPYKQNPIYIIGAHEAEKAAIAALNDKGGTR